MNEHVKSVEQAAESHSPNVKPEILSIAYHAASATDIISDPFADGEPPHTTNRILNLRRIQSWENYFLASAICSVAVATGAEEETLRTLGREKVNSGFHFFSALTGDMFTVLYATNKPCDSGVTNYFFWPQVVKKAYVAFGYDCLYLSNAQIKKDFRAAMNAIKASVDKGIPVLAWGMGNVTMSDGSRYDPLPEACLIGGYDEDDVLYVNLYPGPERMTVDGDGYTAITHGLNTTKGLFFVGGPVEPPHLRRVYSNTIKSIPVFLAMPSSDGYVFGKAALEKWADTLLDEGRFAGKTDEELGGICWDLHCSPYCCVDTSTAEPYIRAAAEVYEIGLAKKLLPLYQRFTHLGQEIGSLHGGFFPPMTKFRTRAFRAQIAEKLQKMGETCNDILHAFEDE